MTSYIPRQLHYRCSRFQHDDRCTNQKISNEPTTTNRKRDPVRHHKAAPTL